MGMGKANNEGRYPLTLLQKFRGADEPSSTRIYRKGNGKHMGNGTGKHMGNGPTNLVMGKGTGNKRDSTDDDRADTIDGESIERWLRDDGEHIYEDNRDDGDDEGKDTGERNEGECKDDKGNNKGMCLGKGGKDKGNNNGNNQGSDTPLEFFSDNDLMHKGNSSKGKHTGKSNKGQHKGNPVLQSLLRESLKNISEGDLVSAKQNICAAIVDDQMS